jgi:hypothetical protein
MDKFVKITKPSHSSAVRNEKRSNQDAESLEQRRSTAIKLDVSKLSRTAATKHLLKTLGHKSNPITHSDIRQRSEILVSYSTGHQVAENGGRGRREYLEFRNKKLRDQMQDSSSGVLRNTRIYINGYLDNTTDIEMKRMITSAGGRVMSVASGATHILTSQTLSASKIHSIITSQPRNKVHVVRPEWVTDSIEDGRRRSEREYAVIKTANRTLENVGIQIGGSSLKQSI